MVCLFAVLYFAGYMLLVEWEESGVKKKLLTAGRFAVSSLCGGGLSAFLLLPMLCEMQNGTSKMNVTREAIGNGARFFYYRSILPLFMACSYDDSQRWDAIGSFPLLYCGVIAILGLLLFFILKNISWKKKLFYAFLMAALLVACNHMNLYFIWHGFYTPFGAPWRFESYRRIEIFNMGIIAFIFAGLLLWKYGNRFGKTVSFLVCILAIGIDLIRIILMEWKKFLLTEKSNCYRRHGGCC